MSRKGGTEQTARMARAEYLPVAVVDRVGSINLNGLGVRFERFLKLAVLHQLVSFIFKRISFGLVLL